MKTNNIPTNTNPEAMSPDALLIYFDKDCKMKLLGDTADLFANDLYIKASIKQGLLTLTTAYGLDFTDDRVAYYPHMCIWECILLRVKV